VVSQVRKDFVNLLNELIVSMQMIQ